MRDSAAALAVVSGGPSVSSGLAAQRRRRRVFPPSDALIRSADVANPSPANAPPLGFPPWAHEWRACALADATLAPAAEAHSLATQTPLLAALAAKLLPYLRLRVGGERQSGSSRTPEFALAPEEAFIAALEGEARRVRSRVRRLQLAARPGGLRGAPPPGVGARRGEPRPRGRR